VNIRETRVKKTFFVLVCFLLCGCGSSQNSHEPAVEFSLIPDAETGGTMRLEPVEGRVFNARPGQQIVLYARSGNWYVQPFTDQPFTKIEANSSWRNTTHLGTEYAALLVEPNYMPPPEISVLPGKDGAVLAIAVVDGTPLFWQTWWFRTLAALVCVALLIAYFRFRMLRLTREMHVRFEERLAERTRIAQELHDSLLQGFVGVSMQIAVAVEQLPADSPVRPQLKRVVKTIEKVVEEGRNTVQGLRSSKDDDFTNLERQFAELRRDLDAGERTDFRILIEGAPKPFCPAIGDEIYHICREALVNAFRHSRAAAIEIEIEYAAREFRVVVRDNGIGITPQIIESGREKHWGLSGMKDRAEKIGARLKVLSRAETGTEIELSVPNQIAFETQNSAHPFKWLAKLNPRRLYSGKEPEK
jgi:signal transduction histidine kinase